MTRAPSPLIPLASLRCEDCGGAEVIAVHPGAEPECVLGTIVIAREDRVRAWCEACAARHGWLEQEQAA